MGSLLVSLRERILPVNISKVKPRECCTARLEHELLMEINQLLTFITPKK